MKKKYMLALVLGFGLLISAPAYAAWWGSDAPVNSQYGSLDTATVGTMQFFRPNGGTAAATTVTASTVVPTKVFVQSITWNWKDEDLAGQFTLYDTPTDENDSAVRKVREFVADASDADNLNVNQSIDFTSGGMTKGIWFKNNPAVLVDSGLNTPVVTILYTIAPKNIVLP